jgi:tripartite-type tricarboxylate transporter receptor subunit TctC
MMRLARCGRVQLMFDNVPTSMEFIKAGKIRPLAATSMARAEVLPDLPTVADYVPGYEARYGISAPKAHFHRDRRQAQP